MKEKEFNLLDEKWIRVIDKNCRISEVSLKDVFVHAHEYSDLSGELPTQDVAILRLLLAVLHTVFARYDLNGNKIRLKTDEDAEQQWESIWENKKFPEKPIIDYLKSQREKFWLFHPTNPFYQTYAAVERGGTEYNSPKLNGELSESSNKLRLFSNASGDDKRYLSFPQAARWLIYVNAYDDTSAKKSTKAGLEVKAGIKSKEDFPSAGAGWLGKLGLITIGGHNLFETLMLNLVMSNDNEEPYNNPKPIWEKEKFPDIERNQIVKPDGLAELYTISSRRLFLKRDDDNNIIGFYLLGGDFFEKENAIIEPMTLWRDNSSKTQKIKVPNRHNASRQFWRSFPILVDKSEKNENRPFVIKWVEKLIGNKYLDDSYSININMASVQYGDKDFFVNNLISDYLSMNNRILSNDNWQERIIQCIELCEQVSKYVWYLGINVNLACGGSDVKDNSTAKPFAENTQRQYYHMLDEPFRKWLAGIDPNNDSETEKVSQWAEQVKKIALELADDVVSQAPPSAIFGIIRIDENKKIEKYSCAEAKSHFVGSVNKAVKNFLKCKS